MTLLLAGAKGQLGHELAKACHARSISCMATGRSELDITDLEAVRSCVKAHPVKAIVNAAAYNAVDQAESDPETAMLVNAVGPRNLAIAAEEAGVTMVHFGTDYVFDGAKRSPYTIGDRPAPLNRYAASKLLGEQLAQTLCRRCFIVRVSWVFGAGGDNFVTRLLSWAQSRSTLRVATDQISCPSYAADLAPAILDLLDTGAYGLYHLTSSNFCTRFDWAAYVLKTAGLSARAEPAKSSDFPSAARRPCFSALDTFPIRHTLGRELPSWQEGTKRFLQEIGAC